MMKSLIYILRIARHEWSSILHDRGILLFVIFMPLGYPIIYSLIYTNEVVHDVPTVVLDECNSSESRELLRHIEATREVRFIDRCHTLAEVQNHLREGAFALIRIPSDFSRRLARKEQATLGLYTDMSSMMYYKSLLMAMNGAVSQMNHEILVERYLPATTDRQAEVTAVPLTYDDVSLYNPQVGFACFLVPPVLMLIIQQSMMLGIGMSAGRLRQQWKGRLLPRQFHLMHSVHIVVGRSLVYLGIYLMMAIYMCMGITRLFGLPQLAHYGTLLAFLLPYLLACAFFAITCSGFIYRREDCILLFVFFSAPLLFVSGISWPGASMPAFWKAVSCLFPSSFGINAYVRISSMGASLRDVALEWRALWMQAGFYFLTACLLYRRHGS